MNKIKEAIRQINIGISNSNTPINVLAYISDDNTNAQQTILANMAIMYGHAEENTVIVDTDFSSAVLSSTFGLTSGYGLSDYLENKSISESQIINKINGQKVSVITSGKIEEGDTDYLIGDPRFNFLINYLVERFDKVLVNTPLFEKIDSMDNLVKVSDGFVLVTTPDILKKKQLYHVMKELKANHAKILGYINVEKEQ